MKPKLFNRFALVAILLLVAQACSSPGSTQSEPQTVVIVVTATPLSPLPLDTATPDAPASTIVPDAPAIVHVSFPAEAPAAGGIFYDVDSRGTAAEHRAPYGDSHRISLFERPFTQDVMDYLPDLDILTFRLDSDANWYFVSVELGGFDPAAAALTGDYAVELDIDRDGHGDYLIWARPPFAASWTTDGVTVYSDANNDTGGLSPALSDAPFNGNGYDTTVVASGLGSDPDLAWVRTDPRSPTTIQFAFKKSLAGNAFMWGVWADKGLKDPSKFSYNDRFTEEQGGSPERSESKLYPIKAIYAVDNTCRQAFGFTPTGEEPLLCPYEQPKPGPSGGGPVGCVNPSQYHDAASCTAAGCAWKIVFPNDNFTCNYP